MALIKRSKVLEELKSKLEEDLYNFEFNKSLAPQDRMEWVMYLRDTLVSLKDVYYNLEQMLDERYNEGYTDGIDVANKEKVFYE